MSAEQATKSVLVREFPTDLLERVDAYASDIAGGKARPSRELTILDLITRGLADATRTRKASR